MAEFLFDFCTNSRLAKIIAPEEPEIKDFNGWSYTPTPYLPYRRSFIVKLEGLRWYLNDAGDNLDTIIDPEHNAGRLEAFYMVHRMHKPFNFNHEYLGSLELRFEKPVSVPEAIGNSGGLIEAFELQMVHHNPAY